MRTLSILFFSILLLSSTVEAAFRDVPEDHLYREEIKEARERGILKGYSDETFRPDQRITRAEFVKLLVSTLFTKESLEPCVRERSDGFTDVSDIAWYAPYLCTAKRAGLIHGYPDGTFRPDYPIAFAEAAKVIVEVFQLPIKEDHSLSWYDASYLALKDAGAIPPTIQTFDQPLNRGEVAKLMAALLQWKEELEGDGSTTPTTGKPPWPSFPHNVSFSHEKYCGVSKTCRTFSVRCGGLPERHGLVTVTEVTPSPQGTVFLVSGTLGKKRYGQEGRWAQATVDLLARGGYRTVELSWSDSEGWLTGGVGKGLISTLCAPSAVALAFQRNFPITGPICAHGGGMGAEQLAYGLTFYGMGSFFDTVLLSDGPPMSSFVEGCNGEDNNPLRFPSTFSLAPTLIDRTLGLSGSRSCAAALKTLTPLSHNRSLVKILDAESLVAKRGRAKNPKGDYGFPRTTLLFLVPKDEPGTTSRHAALYADLLSAASKEFLIVEEATKSAVNSPQGAKYIRELIEEHCPFTTTP